MTAIYKLNESLNVLLDMDQDDQAVIDTLEALGLESDQKCVDVLYYVKHLQDIEDQAKSEIERIKSVIGGYSKRISTLKELVVKNMEARGVSKIEHSTLPVTKIKPRDVCDIYDESKIPKSFIKVKTVESVDKTELLKALKAGEVVEGAEIGKSKSGLKF